MKYLDSKNFWTAHSKSPDKWDYNAIETRMTKAMNMLISYYNNSKNDDFGKRLTSTIHLDELLEFTPDNFYALSEKIILQRTTNDTYYIGDLHSDAAGLDDIIDLLNPYENDIHLIFLGDYVDRGKTHLELLDKLWALKLDLPEQVTLLRGNHDGGAFSGEDILLPYRLRANEIEDDYFPLYLNNLRISGHITKDFMQTYFDLCEHLPQVIFTYQNDKWSMGVHGGLPRPAHDAPYYDYIPSIGALESRESVDIFGQVLLENLFWSDPRPEMLGDISEKRRFNTYENHFNSFSNRFGISELIRGHETVKDGHLAIYNNRVHTIFSSGKGSPDTAYQGVEIPKVLKHSKGKVLEEIVIRESSLNRTE